MLIGERHTEADTAESVHQWTQHFTRLWWECGGNLPPLERAYTIREQAQREHLLDEFVGTISKTLKQPVRDEQQRQSVQQQVAALGAIFAKTALDFDDSHLEAVQSSGIIEAAADFAQQAKRFDPEISSDDIFQAGRNVMTMNLLQLMIGIPVAVTPSIFAYSMLYPYTDNYLDDPQVPKSTKHAFNERFKRRLCGQPITPANPYEQKIADLVAMIEGQYDRSHFPALYASLLDILIAQAHSIRLLQRHASPYEVDVLGLSFEKGGTAVVADAYLVAGTPTPRQLEIAFGYGAFTQLMDDLEDVQRDLHDGILTVFSQTADRWPLDTLTNRLFNLGDWVLRHMDDFGSCAPPSLRDVMQRSVHLLLIDTVGTMVRFYSRPYIADLQAHMPFRFGALKKQRQRLERQRLSIMKVMETTFPAVPGELMSINALVNTRAVA